MQQAPLLSARMASTHSKKSILWFRKVVTWACPHQLSWTANFQLIAQDCCASCIFLGFAAPRQPSFKKGLCGCIACVPRVHHWPPLPAKGQVQVSRCDHCWCSSQLFIFVLFVLNLFAHFTQSGRESVSISAGELERPQCQVCKILCASNRSVALSITGFLSQANRGHTWQDGIRSCNSKEGSFPFP